MRKTKTYAEAKGKKPFDWNKFLHKRKYTHDELRTAEQLSTGWVTCACGNQCSIIPRSVEGIPRDNTLERLGIVFSCYITRLKYVMPDQRSKVKRKARETLLEIEQRSSLLIKRIRRRKRLRKLSKKK